MGLELQQQYIGCMRWALFPVYFRVVCLQIVGAELAMTFGACALQDFHFLHSIPHQKKDVDVLLYV